MASVQSVCFILDCNFAAIDNTEYNEQADTAVFFDYLIKKSSEEDT